MTGRANGGRPPAYWRPFTACMQVLVSLALLSALAPGLTGRSRTVLAIFPDERETPATRAMDKALRDSLGLETDNAPIYLSEFLDVSRFSSSAYDKLLSDFFRNKYAGQSLDVVITIGPLAFQFLRRHQADLFTGIPVVFCGVGRESLQGQTLPSNFVGAPIKVEFLTTIELALRLQPDAHEIVVVTGTSEFDRSWEATLRRDLPRLQSSVPIRYLSGLALDDVLRELSRLPPDTIVYPASFLRDGAGRTYIQVKALRRMADASTAPLYGSVSAAVGFGIVGGYILSMDDLARQAAGLVLRILEGEKISQADVPGAPPSRYVFDWNQLQRWHIPEKKLPPGSIVLYRELNAWQRYKAYIIGFVCLCLAEALLIFGLLWQRAKKREVEESLVERLAFESLISDLSTTFIKLPEEQVDSNIGKCLVRIAEFLRIERITLYEFSANKEELTATSSWASEGVDPAHTVVKANTFPWLVNQVLRGEVLLVSDTNALPEEASAEKVHFQKSGAVSAASVPLSVRGETIGVVSFSAKRRIVWTEGLVKQLRVLAEIFSNALTRKRTIAELKLAESVARESEKRFRLVADTAPVLIWMSGTDKLRTYFNKPWLEFTGRTIEQELENGWSEGVHPEDLQHCLDTHVSSFEARQPFTVEYRLRRADGEYRWLLDKGVSRYTPKGEFAGYIGSCLDITVRKLAEREREALAGRLIHAQEQERSRLAQELHDDFNQRLAVLAIDLERCAGMIGHSPAEASERMLELWNRASEIGADLHTLSHQLHSSTLESLGLVQGVNAFCSEFTEQQGIRVDFAHENIPRSVAPQIALCLFRIVQEGLRNVKKHSGSSRAEVRLEGIDDSIHLSLFDRGTGFDRHNHSTRVGLGVRSMEERLRVIGGRFELQSAPMQGTRIDAWVPLKPALMRAS